LEEASSIILSFNFPFPLETNFHFPPSTYVLAKLAKISMKEGLIISFKGISRVGVLSFDNRSTNHIGKDGKQANT
jgi:hypothetical protein